MDGGVTGVAGVGGAGETSPLMVSVSSERGQVVQKFKRAEQVSFSTETKQTLSVQGRIDLDELLFASLDLSLVVWGERKSTKRSYISFLYSLSHGL